MAENDGLFGMNGVGLLVILFFLMSGGFGGFGANNAYATSNEVQRGFDNQNDMANQREILSAVTSGTAQTVASTNQIFHDLVGYVGDKYTELDRDVLGISALVNQSIANENQCCCNTLRAIDSVKFENAQNTALINATTTAQTQKILDALAQSKIESLEGKIRSLELAQATNGVVRYPASMAYNAGPSPFCSGCGCI